MDKNDDNRNGVASQAVSNCDSCEERVKVLYTKLTPTARIPQRMTSGSAGWDVYSDEEELIPPLGRALISTGLTLKLPSNCYARIAPRSGLAYSHFLDIGAGVIDSDYRGCVSVLLYNFNSTPFKVDRGDRIAQLIIEKIYSPLFVEAEVELEVESEGNHRGSDGFGSSGKK